MVLKNDHQMQQRGFPRLTFRLRKLITSFSKLNASLPQLGVSFRKLEISLPRLEISFPKLERSFSRLGASLPKLKIGLRRQMRACARAPPRWRRSQTLFMPYTDRKQRKEKEERK